MTYFNKSIITDSLGNDVEVGLFGALKTATPTDQVSAKFEIPFDTDRGVTLSSTGAGTVVSQFNRSLGKVQSNGVGTASVQTKRHLRYKPGSTVECYFTAEFGGASATGDESFIGLYDNEDGVYAGYDGADFICAYRNTNVGADVKQIVDVSSYTMSNLHRYRIRFGYLGVGNISIEIFNGKAWDLLHLFETDAALSGRTHIGNPTLPVRMEVSSAANDIYISSGSWNAKTYDQNSKLQDKPVPVIGERDVTPTAIGAPIFAVRNKTAFAGYTNKVRSQPLTLTIATGSEGLYSIDVYRAPAGSLVTGAWVDAKSGVSVIEVNETLTDAPIGTIVLSLPLAVPSSGTGVASVDVDFEKIGVDLYPGEELLFSKREIISGGGDDITIYSTYFNDLF